MNGRTNRWLALCLLVLCAVLAWWLLHRSASDMSAQAKTKGPVIRAMAHLFPDSRPGAVHPAPSAETRRKKPEELRTLEELVEWWASEPDADRWLANLEEFLEVAKSERNNMGLWERWMAGVRRLPVQSMVRRLTAVPNETLEMMDKEARLGNDRRVLAELMRLSPAELEKTGVVDEPAELMAKYPLVGRLLFSAFLGERLSTGEYSLIDNGDIPTSLRRPVELDVVDRLMNNPDKLTDFVLHHASTLTTKDPELKVAGDVPGFFYGPERRIDAVLAAPPSTGRDLLLNAAVLSAATPREDRKNLLAAITEESFRESTAHVR
jgi:hypothetical protein